MNAILAQQPANSNTLPRYSLADHPGRKVEREPWMYRNATATMEALRRSVEVQRALAQSDRSAMNRKDKT